MDVPHVPPDTPLHSAVRPLAVLLPQQHRARPVVLGALPMELAEGPPQPLLEREPLAAPSIVQPVVVATLLQQVGLSAALMTLGTVARIALAPAARLVEALLCLRCLNNITHDGIKTKYKTTGKAWILHLTTQALVPVRLRTHFYVTGLRWFPRWVCTAKCHLHNLLVELWYLGCTRARLGLSSTRRWTSDELRCGMTFKPIWLLCDNV